MAYRYYESVNQEALTTTNANILSNNMIPVIDFPADLENPIFDDVNVVYCTDVKTLFVRLEPGTGTMHWNQYGSG
jgi:hypothetical protein